MFRPIEVHSGGGMGGLYDGLPGIDTLFLPRIVKRALTLPYCAIPHGALRSSTRTGC
jgi:hypothetical protein